MAETYKNTIKGLERVMAMRIEKGIPAGMIPETIEKLRDGALDKDDIIYIKQLFEAATCEPVKFR